MRTLFILVLFIIWSTALSAQERLLQANGRTFRVFMKGFENRTPGTPAVIFENGLGVDLSHWNTILDSVARFAPVFAYDRTGTGESERIFRMPTIQSISNDLKALLQSAHVDPPYILVGHSLGGVFIRAFAGYFPGDIAGLVFIDPADFLETSDDWRTLLKDMGVSHVRIEEMMRARLYGNPKVDSANFGVWSEAQLLASLRKSDFKELNALPVPTVPIYFFVGGKFEVPRNNWSKDFDHPKFFLVKTSRNVDRWEQFVYKYSSGGAVIYLTDCGHFVHRDNPESVIGNLRVMFNSLNRK
jgi:pimeloyl-ACP methyl ester carboxylesterase